MWSLQLAWLLQGTFAILALTPPPWLPIWLANASADSSLRDAPVFCAVCKSGAAALGDYGCLLHVLAVWLMEVACSTNMLNLGFLY